MAKTFRVSPISRAQIRRLALETLADIQPDALRKPQPSDVERLFDVYVPRKLGIQTGYVGYDEIPAEAVGVTKAIERKSYWPESCLKRKNGTNSVSSDLQWPMKAGTAAWGTHFKSSISCRYWAERKAFSFVWRRPGSGPLKTPSGRPGPLHRSF